MSTLTASVKLNVTAALSNALDIGTANFTVNETFSQSFANGTGASQANQVWSDTRQIAASGNDDLDLAGGLTNALGTSLTFTSIKGIFVKAAATNTNNLIIGAEGSAVFGTFFGDDSDTLILPPGTFLGLCNPNADGYVVTATTGDMLRFTNSAGSTVVDYDVIFIGETA